MPDAGQPCFVQLLVVGDAIVELLLRRARWGRRQPHQRLRGVDELAVQPAIGVLRDAAARGLGGLLADARAGQRRRVEDVFMPAAHEHDRILRRDAIEIIAQRQPLFFQLRFMPVAVRDDHVARFQGLDAGAERRLDVGHRSRARQIDAGAAAGAVEMVVHQPRDHAAPLEIDHSRRRSGDRAHLVVVADGHDAIADDRHGFMDREAAIDGDDLSVEEHEIRRRWSRQDWTLRRQRRRGHESDQQSAKHRRKHTVLSNPRFVPAISRTRPSCQTVGPRQPLF